MPLTRLSNLASKAQEQLGRAAELELTRFGGHLNTWDDKSRMKEVDRADEVYQALSTGVPG